MVGSGAVYCGLSCFHDRCILHVEGTRMKALVTGGSGFIGSHLVQALLDKEIEVVIGDVNRSKIDHDSYWVFLDVTKRENVKDILEKHDFDIIYHLAAVSLTLGEDWRHDYDTFAANAMGTYNIASQCSDDATIVFSSTANLYGNVRKATESNPIKLSSMYGYSKCIAEQIISHFDLRHIIFRFGTVVGTRGRCFPNRLVWCVVNRKPVEFFNNGETSRDLVDARDVVDGLLIAERLPDGVWNLGGEREISGRLLASVVRKEAELRGYDPNFSFVSTYPNGYVLHSTLDSLKLLSTGLWKPKIEFQDTIRTLFDYYEHGGFEPPSWESL